MKERPILFSGPMVRAILEGRKTQTRRAIKEQPPERYSDLYPECNWRGKIGPVGWFWSRSTSGAGAEQQDLLGIDPCPHGTVGDRLWVRESWAPAEAALPLLPGVLYRADYHTGLEKRDGDQKWKPSIHMKRQDSRITLEITGVRVERLQEISDGDAQAEGVDPAEGRMVPLFTYTEAFELLWNQINGPESWAANPWVWVIEFRRIEQ